MKSRIIVAVCLLVILGGWGFTPDKRPIGIWWTGPEVSSWPPSEIQAKIVKGVVERPWKRYMVHQPASWSKAGPMSNAQYWPVSAERRAAYIEAIQAANAKKRKFYIYGGIFLEQPFSIEFTNPAQAHVLDMSLEQDRFMMWDCTVKLWKTPGLDG